MAHGDQQNKEKEDMLKFDRQQKVDSVNGALALRPRIEKVVD